VPLVKALLVYFHRVTVVSGEPAGASAIQSVVLPLTPDHVIATDVA
jgi:hypothetical protein